MLAEPTVALVPCVDVGVGTETATIRNVRTREKVKLKGVRSVALVNRTACVRLAVLSREGGESLVLLPGDRVAWVRPLAYEPGEPIPA